MLERRNITGSSSRERGLGGGRCAGNEFFFPKGRQDRPDDCTGRINKQIGLKDHFFFFFFFPFVL